MPRAASQLWVVLGKELKDAIRDRRSWMSLVFGALVGPLLIGFMLNRLADRQRRIEDVRIPVVGMAHAPALMDWLRQQAGVEVVEGPADPERAVRDRDEEVVIVIPDDFIERFRASKAAPVKVVSDGSRTDSRPKVVRVRSLLQRYSTEIGSLRLVGRGVSPGIAAALRLEDVEVSSAQQRAAMVLNFIPLFIILAAFTGGMQIATDSTAGERERGSLEPLLVNPAPRGAIASGKWLAATTMSVAGVLVTSLLCLAMLRAIPLQDLGVRFRLGGDQVWLVLAAVLPLCPLAAGLQIYLATFARSFKEAQSYMGFLIMVPMLPGLLATLYPFGEQRWMAPIPILGQHVLLADVIGGKPTGALLLLAGAVSSLTASVALVALASRLLRRESIVFGR